MFSYINIIKPQSKKIFEGKKSLNIPFVDFEIVSFVPYWSLYIYKFFTWPSHKADDVFAKHHDNDNDVFENILQTKMR